MLELESRKVKILGLLAIALSSMITAPLLIQSANASSPITWTVAKSFYSNGSLIYVVLKGGNLYAEADFYRYYYSSGGWQGGLVGYFAVQGYTTWYGSTKITVTAYLCATNGYCYPVRTWETSSPSLMAVYLRQYLQNFLAAICYYTNCWALTSYVQSLIAPFISYSSLGYIFGIPFIYFVYMALTL